MFSKLHCQAALKTMDFLKQKPLPKKEWMAFCHARFPIGWGPPRCITVSWHVTSTSVITEEIESRDVEPSDGTALQL